MKFNLCVIESVMNKYGMGRVETFWKSFETKDEREQYLVALKGKYDKVEFKREETNENINAMYVVADKVGK